MKKQGQSAQRARTSAKRGRKIQWFLSVNNTSHHHKKFTLDQGQRSCHQMKAHNYVISYMSIMQMKSLSLIVFVIFEKIAVLTFDLGPRTKVMAANESLCMISYMSVIQMKSLSLVVFKIFAKIAFLPWIKVKGHGSKQKPIYDFLYVCNTNEVSISHCFSDICENSICGVTFIIELDGPQYHDCSVCL